MTLKKRVLRCIANYPGMTSREIARHLRIKPFSAAVAVNSLMNDEAITTGPKRRCSITGILVWPWHPQTIQLRSAA